VIFLLIIDGSLGRKTCLNLDIFFFFFEEAKLAHLDIIVRVYAANSSDVNFSELYKTNEYCYLPSLFLRFVFFDLHRRF
jgi:hypothetical protein